MNLQKELGKFPLRNLDCMIVGACDVLDGLSRLLSLGFCSGSEIGMSYLVWRTELMHRSNRPNTQSASRFNHLKVLGVDNVKPFIPPFGKKNDR